MSVTKKTKSEQERSEKLLQKIERERLIKVEFNKFKKPFVNLEKDKKVVAYKLCEQLAFMSITLDELTNKVNSEGSIIVGINGNGFATKSEHPAQKSYNVMIKNFNATIKTLIDLLPGEDSRDDELQQFLRRDKK